MFFYIKKYIKSFLYILCCLILSLFLIVLSRNFDGFGQWYATTFFPILPNTIGRLWSQVPFSIFEFLLLGLLFFVTLWILIIIVAALRRKSYWKKFSSALFRMILCTGASALLLVVLGCSINYAREPFAASAHLTIRESNPNELRQLSYLLISDAEQLVSQVNRDEDRVFKIDSLTLKQDAIKSMKRLGQTYPALAGYYPNPKPVTFSRNLSQLNLTGIFTPFTMEANYNDDVADYAIPYTICHELAHLKGFIKEDEAGFISYLACRNSESVDFRYSGTLNALVYVLNALYSDIGQEEYNEIYRAIPELVRTDFAFNRSYWKQFEGKINHMAQVSNDYYLKANAQVEGTKSYGKMVDLLLALYAEEIKEPR